jgi:hypothetical protein
LLHKASIILVADVGPETIQYRFHDLSLGWTKEKTSLRRFLKPFIDLH